MYVKDGMIHLSTKSPPVHFVIFVRPTCPFCVEAKPEIEKLKNKVPVTIYDVSKPSGDNSRKFFSQYLPKDASPNTVPSFYIFIDGKIRAKYNGGRTADLMIKAAYEAKNKTSSANY